MKKGLIGHHETVAAAQVTIAIIEDSPLMQQHLCEICRRIPGVEVVGIAASVAEARGLIAATRPSIISLDLWLKDGSSLPLVAHLREQCPESAIIVFTQNADPFIRRKATSAGATHFIDKADGFTELSRVVRDLVA